jgi:hypothetical protein
MPTRTRNAHYQHPSMTEGVVHFEDEVYPVVAGVVECPLEVGEGADWERAEPEQIEAHQKARAAKAAKDAKKKSGKPDGDKPEDAK